MLTKEEARHLLDMIEALGNYVDYGYLRTDEQVLHESACEKLAKIARGES